MKKKTKFFGILWESLNFGEMDNSLCVFHRLLAFGFYFFLLKLFSSRESILFTEVINLIMLLPAFCLLFANGFCQITKPTLNTKAIVRPKCLNKSNIHTLAFVRLNEIERQATHAHTVENDHRVNQMICTRV